MKKVAFIINPITPRAHLVDKQMVLSTFSATKYEISFHTTEYHWHAKKLTQELISEGVDIIAIAGGAGTIHQVLQEVTTTDVNIAIFPTGCGNGYARYIELPFKFDHFLQAIKEGFIRKVDVGQVEWNEQKRYFLSWFCFGATPLIAKAGEGKSYKSFLSYILSGYKVLWKYQPKNEIIIDHDGLKNTRTVYEVLIGNIPSYKGSLSHQKYSSVKDGVLDVNILNSKSYMGVIRYGISLLVNQSDNLFHFSDIHKSSKIYIHFNERTDVHSDLEPFQVEGDVSITNLNNQLNLIVPRNLDFL